MDIPENVEIGEGLSVRLPNASRARKQPQDTAIWCRERAAANLAQAAETTGDNARLKLEHSAESWSQRADLLDRLEASFQARLQANLSLEH